ncbi:hypothetical protein E6O75_ATG02853 [Venturia nashicola]|uniref:Uncharacterized protein n=1 Tax=Venturia nashicola TaxID=86259 RepID=A0A4Z1P994_9PEZI|nr:hypothetical protein E6O75_ATG02853 [Venturia nashicola]
MSVFVFLINAHISGERNLQRRPILGVRPTTSCSIVQQYHLGSKKAPLASPYHVDVRGAIVLLLLLLLLLLSRCLQSPSPPSEGAVFGIVYKRGM